jgi:tRNA-binding EMAP/Myf-like protein
VQEEAQASARAHTLPLTPHKHSLPPLPPSLPPCRLWCEEIDLGEEGGPRSVASGLREHYSAEAMTGRLVVVVCNLKPRTMKGFASEGMVLCAKAGEGVEFIDPPPGAVVGERVSCSSIPPDAPWPVPEVINPAKEPNAWANVAGGLSTDAARVACFSGQPLTTSAGPCTAPRFANAPIS